MDIRTIRTEGLGDATYVMIHEGLAVVVDPQRDIDRFETVLEETGAELRFVLETHLHNDYISGGRDLARRLHGELILPAGAAPVFRHRPAFHQEDINAGPLTLRPIHTPGHTPEHISYAVILEGRPVAVFSGGSLLVGAAGRSDLLGVERAETLARLQYLSVNRLAQLPEEVGLYPTHGEGSFCTASGAGKDTSTIGEEKRNNPVLAYPDEDSFVKGQLSGLAPYPAYYRFMGPANVSGVEPIGSLRAPNLTEDEVARLDEEVFIVDARPKTDYAAGHISGSVAIELRDDFGVWTGWVLPYGSPIALVTNPDQDSEEAIRQLARIGFDDVRGVVTGLSSWQGALRSYRTVDVDEFTDAIDAGAQILDVRAPNEWDEGIVTDSVLSYVPDVVATTPQGLDPDRPVWLACATGYRANIAGSVLESRGFEPVVLLDTGVTEVLTLLSKKGLDRWCAGPMAT